MATDEHKNKSMVKSAPTTQLVSQIVLSGGRTISYEYDEEERITKVDDSVDGITEYTYDALGQLVSEVKDNQTVVNTMTYDNYGNILTKNGVVYAYDTVWKDKLIKVGTGENSTITYDAQGNPVNYLGHTLTWEKGRQLKSFDNIAYTYNANGIRTSKTVNGVRHDYVLDGAKILRETWGDNTLVPLYDNEDSVCGIEYNGAAYYFLKNQQGDIIAITDSWGNVVARYRYDAWGVCTVADDTSGCGIANINPFRYRGYYYDKEIGMYYLQSRYYDPTVGRFVNGDEAEVLFIEQKNITQYNHFAYCLNSPTNNKDINGKWVQIVVNAFIGAVFAALTYWLEYKLGMRNWNGWTFTGLILVGAGLGALGGYAKYWIKISNLALKLVKMAKWSANLAPIVEKLILLAITGLKFLINGVIKKFSRKPGESWPKTIKRILGWG